MPFTMKRIDPLSSGMPNLSLEVKVVSVCASVLECIGKNVKVIMRTIASPGRIVLRLSNISFTFGYPKVFSLGYKPFQPKRYK